jgi:hypothetical protein
MRHRTPRWCALGSVMLALLIAAHPLAARDSQQPPPFRYMGGTESITPPCEGKLEVTTEALIFNCPFGTLNIPFASISLMEYRPDISRAVRKIKVKWKVRPDPGGGKRNRYFTVVYKEQDATHIAVLRVSPLAMRPYLAEIELKSGKRVQVMGYEEYL